MKVDIKDSIYELVESGDESITVRCKIDGREEVWTPTESDQDAVYELVVEGKTYHYDHAKSAAPTVAAALKAIKLARTAKNAELVDGATKSLRSILASLEPLVKAKFEVSAAVADRACQIVYVACEGDASAEVGLAQLHKAGKVVEALAGRVEFPKGLLEASSDAFKAAWAEAQKVILADSMGGLKHGDIVKFLPDSAWFRPGYFRVDLEKAVQGRYPTPWIEDLATGAGWYIDRPDQLEVVLPSDTFNTETFHSNEDVEEALDDDEYLGKVTAAAKVDPIQDLQELYTCIQAPTEEDTARYDRLVTALQGLKSHEAAPEEDGKFEVNCVGEGSKVLWSKKVKTKKEALALVSEAKKSEALHIELITESQTWYYDRKSTEDKWTAPVEM
jgi:hypothetical protein